MQRRRYLALVSVGAATLAGCVQPSRSDTNPEPTSTAQSPTTSPTSSKDGETTRISLGESASHDGRQVTVMNPRVRKVVATQGVHTRLVTPELVREDGESLPGQFLVVDVHIDGQPASALDTIRLLPATDGAILPETSPISVADAAGRFAFPFPRAVPEQASIRWETGEGSVSWTLPDDIRGALGSEPSFEIQDVAVQRQDGDLVLELEVSNDGDRDGRFMARVSQRDFSGGDIVTFEVPEGESRAQTVSPEVLLYLDNAGGGTLTVQYLAESGLETLEHLVEVDSTTTDSNS